MDGQPNRRGYSDPPHANQQPQSGAPQNTRGNSFGELSGNRSHQLRANPAPSISRQDSSALQQQQIPFGHSFYDPTNQSTGTNILSQHNYNYASAGPAQQQGPSSYYHAAYSSGPSYPSATQPPLANSYGFNSNPFPQRQVAQPPQLSMNYNINALYDPDDQLLDAPLQPQQHLLPPPYEQARQQAAYAAPQLPPLPPLPPNPQPGSGGQAIANQTLFEAGMDRVYTALRPITTIITSHGDLNQASALLLTLSDQFLSRVEQMELTVDHPGHETSGLRLWQDFNHAWLALFQQQYSRIHDLQQSGAPLNDPQLMTQATIYRVITDLSELAREHVEDRGLLDHEWGVWEDNITRAADRCMKLFSSPEADEDEE